MAGAYRRIATTLLAGSLLLAACGGGGGGGGTPAGGGGGGGDKDEGSKMRTVAGKDLNDHGTKDVSSSDDVDVEVDSFYFEPTVLTGTPGEKLTVELENESDTLHNFSLPQQGIDQDVESDSKEEVSVTFPKSGSILFFCKYHASQGMRGALQVGG